MSSTFSINRSKAAAGATPTRPSDPPVVSAGLRNAKTPTGSINGKASITPSKTPNGFGMPSAAVNGQSDAASPRRREPTTPRPEDLERVSAWQNDVGSLEQKQMELQNNQMNLLHNQIHILTRELGDLQNKFVEMQVSMTATQEEAHSALRLELAEHGNNAEEMRKAWEEAHKALKDSMDDGLASLADEHAKALEAHKADTAQSFADQKESLSSHGSNLSDLEDLHNKRYEEHSACLEKGLSDVHANLKSELEELRSGHEVNLRAVVTDVTSQVEKLTGDVEQMATDLKNAQEEAHSALRLELAEHGNNAAEMKAAWEEAHKALKDSMDDGLSTLAEEHAKALEAHKADTAQAFADQAANMDNHGSNLNNLEDLHNQRYEEHSATLEKGLSDVHGNLKKELEELRSGHEVNLKAVVTDITSQVEKLTGDVEQMATDLKAAQEEAHSALRLELAEHGNNADEMKAAWEEAHKALSQAMDDNLSQLAEDHAKALEDHKSEQAQALVDHADNLSTHGNNLSELEDVHNKRYEEHSACLEKGLEDVHGTLQKELEELRSGHAVNLQAVVTDVTNQLDKLTLDVEQLAKDVAAAQEEAHSALRLELAEHGNNVGEMKAAWEEAHKALSQAMDDNLSQLADQHAKALDDHKSEQAQALADHADSLNNHGSNLTELEELHNKRYEEHSAVLEKGLEDVHGTLQKELADLRSGHEVNLKAVVTDVTDQVDKLTLDLETLAKDVATAQEEAHSALRLELAEHGNNAAEMKAAWEEAHKALSNAMDDGLANLATENAKALDDHKSDHAKALADHADTSAEIQAQLRGEIDGHADNLKSLTEMYDAKHAEHVENTAKMEAGLQQVLGSTHDKLQADLADLRSGHASNLKQILEDITQQTDNITLSLEQESELRKIMEVKLDKLFEGMRGLMSVSFLGNGVDEQAPSAAPTTPAKPEPAARTKSPSRGK